MKHTLQLLILLFLFSYSFSQTHQITPVSQTVCYNENAQTLNCPTNVSDFWYMRESQSGSFTQITGTQGNITFTPTNLTVTTQYTIGDIDENYCNIVTVSVREEFAVGSISGNQTICYNSIPNQILGTAPTGGDGVYDYQWEQSSNGTSWSTISSAILENYQPASLTQTTHFRRKDINSACNVSEYTNSVTVTVRDVFAVGSISGNQTICYNSIPNQILGTAPTGGDGVYDYQWEQSSNGTSWSTISSAIFGDYQPDILTQTTYFRRKDINSGCNLSEYTNSVTVTVREELSGGTIGSNQTVCYETIPDMLNQFVAVSGGSGNYSYLWEKSHDSLTFEEITTATINTYQPLSLIETTHYRRKVIDNICSSFAYSNTVIITVLDKLSAGQIGADEQLPYNSTPSLINTTISATGYDSYQWQYSNNLSSWNNIQNQTNESFQPPALTSTTYYRRMAISTQCGTAISNVVTKHIYDEVVGGEIGFDTGVYNITVCYGTIPDVIISIEDASGGNEIFNYQWEESLNQTLWTDITGAENANYQPTQPATVKKYYKRKATADIGGISYSNVVLIDVYTELTAVQIGSNQTICYNTIPEKLVIETPPTGGTGVYTYQWQQSEDENTWTDIQNANQNNFTPNNLIQTTYFRLKIINTCAETISNTVTISVSEEFLSGTIGDNQTIIYGAIPQEIISLSSPIGGNGSYSYQWQNSFNGTSWSNIQGETDDNYQPTALFQTEYFKLLTTDALCGVLESNIVTITVADELLAGEIGYNQTVCSDQRPAPIVTVISPTGGIGNYIITWQFSENGTNWNTITGESTNSYQPEILNQTTYFRKTISTELNSEVITNEVIITVFEALQSLGIGNDQTINYNEVPELLQGDIPTGGNGSYTYQWRKSENYGVLWTDIQNATNKDYQPDALIITTLFVRISMSGVCNSLSSNVVIITVGQNLKPGEISENQTVCFNAIPEKLTGTKAEGGNGTFLYQWQQKKDNSDWIDILDEINIDYQPDKITEVTHFRRKVTSGNAEAFSNTVTIELSDASETPIIDYESFYCKNVTAVLKSNMETIWYDSEFVELFTGTEYEFTTEYPIIIYVTAKNGDCTGAPQAIEINVDYVDTEIKTNLEDNSMVENGTRIVFYPNIKSNYVETDLSYEWEFYNNEYKQIYETHYDMEPAQYFHWEGCYAVTLTVNTPNKCKFIETNNDFFCVAPEKPDDSQKDINFTDDFQDNVERELLISLFPNPFKTSLIININLESFRCEVFMITGQKILEHNLIKGDNNLNTGNLPTGIYTVKILNQKGEIVTVEKLVKH